MVYKTFARESLEYHSAKDAYDSNGKTGTLITKPCESSHELSMAYSPGVVYPCSEIEKNDEKVYDYTNKGNLVAVVSNGTAVLGLGDIGALASKPALEGKAVLFKKFANIDAVDIEVDSKDTETIIQTIKTISSSFGAISLENIKAPECFEIERRLKKECNVPVFHDDQHGTAVITTAGLINMLELTDKKPNMIKIVIIGAGTSAIASASMYRRLGVENIYMFDSKGIICKEREDLNRFKEEFVANECISLEKAIGNADMVLGLSKGDIITPEMVSSMSDRLPIIFACANPDPEIMPDVAKEVRPDLIIGTSRSDFPNQVNHVLAFPNIFRGALDVRASDITENMKMAAAEALAMLTREDVTLEVKRAHGREEMTFGTEYIIPSPFDKRVMLYVAPAVAEAAVKDGVAGIKSFIKERYIDHIAKIAKRL